MILLFLPFVSAAYISLQMTAETNDTEGTITVKHLGDETAYQVQVVSRIFDNEYKREIVDVLKVGDNFTESFSINLSSHRVGTYPLFVTVYYQDKNGYLFSTLLSKIVKNSVTSRSEISVELNDSVINDRTKVPVTIRNFGEESKNLRLFLFMSDEFIVKDNNRSIVVASKTSEDVVFEVENFGARTNSTYAFYAIAEYDEQNEHFSSISDGKMRVINIKKGFFDKNVLIFVLAAIALIFIVMQFVKKK